MKKYNFISAVPVWQKDKDKEKNYNLVFRTIISKATEAKICLTASNMYQMFVNGSMISEGPARAGHGYYRVDEIDITNYLTQESNIICVYVNSYYIKNFSMIKQPAFLCAEVICDERVVAATGKTGFEAKYHNERLRKVGRLSPMRGFSEVYRMNEETYRDFETDTNCCFQPVELTETEPKNFISREVPYPCYDDVYAQRIISRGTFTYADVPPEPNNRSWIEIGGNPNDPGFSRKEAECVVLDEIDKCICTSTDKTEVISDTAKLSSHEWCIFDLKTEQTGFINFDIKCDSDTELILSYDELLIDGEIKFRSNLTTGAVWYLSAGTYSLICNEPYSARYIKFANNSNGDVTISKPGIKGYTFGYLSDKLCSDDEILNSIYSAAVATFRQNTVDIYMDCPSRERAGYLCDSYFTALAERFFTGKSDVEKSFLENFLYNEGFTDVPDYMFPMCYPSDFADQEVCHFIPNWAMWYVIELEEYFDRTEDRDIVNKAKAKILKLYDYFKKFSNSDGLLEKLEKWVFIEWSKANDFVQDVSYPTNMLYARMLYSMGRLYDDKYTSEAEEIIRTIRKQSYFDGFFHDHAVRNADNRLEVIATDISETCQYYAFFTGAANTEEHKELWDILLKDFGPERESKGLWKNIHTSAAFIGNCLRLYLLDKYGEKEILLDNIKKYYYDMSVKTNTLWEQMIPESSCNHGFASVIAKWIKNNI